MVNQLGYMIQNIYDFLSGAVPGGIFLLTFILASLNLLLYHLYKLAKLISRESYRKNLIQYNIILCSVYLIIWFVLKPDTLPESVIILPFQKGDEAEFILCEAIEHQINSQLNGDYFLHPWEYFYQTVQKDSFSFLDHRIQLAEKMGIRNIITGSQQINNSAIKIDLRLSIHDQLIQANFNVQSYQHAVFEILNLIKKSTDILKNNNSTDKSMMDEEQLVSYTKAKLLYLNGRLAEAKTFIRQNNMLFDILSANILLNEGIKLFSEKNNKSSNKMKSGSTVIEDIINPHFQHIRKLLYPYAKEGKDNAEINKILGRVSLYEKNYESAETFLKKAWMQNRSDSRIYYDMSYLNNHRLKELGFKNRIKLLERAVYFDPGFKDAVYELANDYFGTGTAIPSSPNTVNAIKILNNFLLLNANEADILSLLASIYVKIKETEQAIILYKKVLEKNPGQAEIHYNLGVCYFNLQEYDIAKKYFQEAIRINDHSDSYLYLGGIYKLQNDFDKALYYFRERVKRKKDDQDEYARQAMRGIRIVLDKMAKKESRENEDILQ